MTDPILARVPLKLLCSMAPRETLAELAAAYQRANAQPVELEAAGGVDVARRVQQGEAADVVVLTGDGIDRLIGQGALLAGERVDLMRSGIAIAVRAGAPRPDIATEDAVRRAVSAARTVSYSTGPSGVWLQRTFERWGILEQMRARIIVPPPGVPVGSLVADGSAELGFQQLSELMNRPGIEVIGPMPAAIQTITVFSGGIGAGCRRHEAAWGLLEYLASPAVADVKRRYGMDAA